MIIFYSYSASILLRHRIETELKKNIFYKCWYLLEKKVLIAVGLGFVETINGLLGINKTAILPSFLQNLGRNIVVWMIHFSPQKEQDSPLVAILLILWTTIEVVRLPYYMSVLIKFKVWPLTWLRYTIWMPIYPVGVTTEIAIVWFCCWEKSKAPGMIWLFLFIRILMVCQILSVAFNYRYLWNQRKKQMRRYKQKTA